MNRFLHEIAELTELPYDSVFSSYRCLNLSGRAVYVQGHKGFVTFDASRAVFRVEKKRLCVSGENLHIKHLSQTDAVITGEIVSVTTE